MEKKGLGIISIVILVILIGVATMGVIFLTGNFNFFIDDVPGNAGDDGEIGSVTGDTDNDTSTDGNVTDETFDDSLYFDLLAVNLTLENGGCEDKVVNNTNVTHCSMDIDANIKNSGTITIETDFDVQIIDVTSSSHLIDIDTVSENLSPGKSVRVGTSYLELEAGEYWVQIVVDSSRKIDEINENNNILSDAVDIF